MINLYIYLNIYQIYQILPVYLQSTSYTRYNDTHKQNKTFVKNDDFE
jgi:hypothetical protein